MGIEITWLGHSTAVVDLDGVRIVADPLLRRNNGILSGAASSCPRPRGTGPTRCSLSHLHHDHAEVPSLKRFGVPVLTAPDNAVWVRKKGLTAGDWPTTSGSPSGPTAWSRCGWR